MHKFDSTKRNGEGASEDCPLRGLARQAYKRLIGAPSNVTPNLPSLTAEQLVELLGPHPNARYDGALTVTLWCAAHQELDSQREVQGRCIIDLNSVLTGFRLLLVGRDEEEARRTNGPLTLSGKHEADFYWLSPQEQVRLALMLPALKASARQGQRA